MTFASNSIRFADRPVVGRDLGQHMIGCGFSLAASLIGWNQTAAWACACHLPVAYHIYTIYIRLHHIPA